MPEITTCDPPSMHLWVNPDLGDLCWCGQVEYEQIEIAPTTFAANLDGIEVWYRGKRRD